MSSEQKGNRTRKKPKDTRERLLDTAERLFAEKGIRTTSLREITRLSRANLAAVNYHFHSKSALVQAVYERSFGPLNRERLRLLDEAEAAARNQSLRIESVLRALFEPMVRTWMENRNFILLAGRLQYEPDVKLHRYILSLYEELIRRFFAAATRAVPDVPRDDVFWWVHFLFTGMVHTLLSSEDLEKFSGGLCDCNDAGKILDRMINFGAAGLRGASAPDLTAPAPASLAKQSDRVRRPSRENQTLAPPPRKEEL